MSTIKYYTITLTPGTTSPGPYTIYLNQVNGTIPLRYPSLTNAENIDRDTLLAGVTIQTNGIPEYIVIFNEYEYCQTSITIPTPTTITYKDFCLKFVSNGLPSVVFKSFISKININGTNWKTRWPVCRIRKQGGCRTNS